MHKYNLTIPAEEIRKIRELVDGSLIEYGGACHFDALNNFSNITKFTGDRESTSVGDIRTEVNWHIHPKTQLCTYENVYDFFEMLELYQNKLKGIREYKYKLANKLEGVKICKNELELLNDEYIICKDIPRDFPSITDIEICLDEYHSGIGFIEKHLVFTDKVIYVMYIDDKIKVNDQLIYTEKLFRKMNNLYPYEEMKLMTASKIFDLYSGKPIKFFERSDYDSVNKNIFQSFQQFKQIVRCYGVIIEEYSDWDSYMTNGFSIECSRPLIMTKEITIDKLIKSKCCSYYDDVKYKYMSLNSLTGHRTEVCLLANSLPDKLFVSCLLEQSTKFDSVFIFFTNKMIYMLKSLKHDDDLASSFYNEIDKIEFYGNMEAVLNKYKIIMQKLTWKQISNKVERSFKSYRTFSIKI